MSDMEPRAFNRDMLAKTVSSFAIHLLVFSHAGCLKSTQHLLGKVGGYFYAHLTEEDSVNLMASLRSWRWWPR